MTRLARLLAVPAFAAFALAGTAHGGTIRPGPNVAETSCAPGAYSVVISPDATSVTILFDDLTLNPAPAKGVAVHRMSCHIQAPLHLPAGYSFALYRVDYRGFAHLQRGQVAKLSVDYELGEPKRRILGGLRGGMVTGPRDGEFSFTEIIPQGQMKRVGCGDSAMLDLTARVEMQGVQSGAPMVTLDSIDGGAAVTYRFDLQKC